MTDYFSHLDDQTIPTGSDVRSNDEIKKRASMANGGETTYEQIVCPKCHGRGSLTYGYVNIRTYPCRICKATGKVNGRRLVRVEAAKKAKVTAERNLAERAANFRQENEEVVAYLGRTSEWNEFSRKMLDTIRDFGGLTDGQLNAVKNGMLKAAEREANKKEKLANAPSVDVSAIHNLFDVAQSNRLKKPKFRALDGIEISQAPANGVNAGALYVKQNGEYSGKIANGKFIASNAKDDVLPRLLKIAADPKGEAVLFGKQTGVCGCCGRELENPESVSLGIGPVCRDKWGL